MTYCQVSGQRGVYEIVVGKQPTVGAGLPRPPPMYRPVSPWSSSKRGLIMSFNTFIQACGGLLTGRYIGGGRGKPAPTVGCLPTPVSYTPWEWVRFIFLHTPLLDPRGWQEAV